MGSVSKIGKKTNVQEIKTQLLFCWLELLSLIVKKYLTIPTSYHKVEPRYVRILFYYFLGVIYEQCVDNKSKIIYYI